MIKKQKNIQILSIFALLWLAVLFLFNFFSTTIYATTILGFTDIYYWLIVFVVVVFCLYFYSIKDNLFLDKDVVVKRWYVFYLLFSIIVLISFFNIFTNLWKLPYHQDEKYHFSPAYTYSKTWEFSKWDFLYNEIWDAKWTDRNKSLSIMTSYSQDLFRFNEFSSRLPVAIVWFLWIFLIYFVVIKFTKNHIIWLISMYTYSVNDVIIYFSRFIRAYIFLIVFALILFFLLYKLINEEKFKKKIFYALLSLILFFLCLFEFHATIILLFPFLIVVLFIVILKTFSFKKYYQVYIWFFILWLVFVLNSLWIITLFKMPFGIQNMVNLGIDFFNPKKIYLSHITNPFNLWYPLVFLLISNLFIKSKKLKFNNLFLVFWVFVPLFFSQYFFNRYEDFRYIALLQWIFIIFVSLFIYYIWFYIINNWKHKNYILLMFITILFVPFQFPYFPQINPFSKVAQANWQNIEWSRIHFRLAEPENTKVFDYIFNNYDDIVLLRLPDWWINWDDNYYLSLYLKKYPNKKVEFYNGLEMSNSFVETYNSDKEKKDLLEKISFFDIQKLHDNLIIVWSTRDLVDDDLMKYIDKNCENIAPKIGVVKYRIFEYKHPEDNYFPNVFVCNKK